MVIHPRRDEVLWHVGGVLEGSRLEELERHLAGGCPGCERCAAESRAVIDSLVLALRPSRPPASARLRLRARLEGEGRWGGNGSPGEAGEREEGDARSASGLRRGEGEGRAWGRPLLAAAIGLSILASLLYEATTRNREPGVGSAAEGVAPVVSEPVVTADTPPDDGEGSMLMNMLASASARIASMSGEVEASESWGRLIWDRTGGAGLLYLAEMEGAIDGESYRLWFVTDRGSVVPGGKVSGRHGWKRVWVPEVEEPIVRTGLSYEPGEAESSPASLLLSGDVVAWNEAEME